MLWFCSGLALIQGIESSLFHLQLSRCGEGGRAESFVLQESRSPSQSSNLEEERARGGLDCPRPKQAYLPACIPALQRPWHWTQLWAPSKQKWPKLVHGPVQVTDVCQLVWCSGGYTEIYFSTPYETGSCLTYSNLAGSPSVTIAVSCLWIQSRGHFETGHACFHGPRASQWLCCCPRLPSI